MSTNKIKSYGKEVIEIEISGAKKLFKTSYGSLIFQQHSDLLGF